MTKESRRRPRRKVWMPGCARRFPFSTAKRPFRRSFTTLEGAGCRRFCGNFPGRGGKCRRCAAALDSSMVFLKVLPVCIALVSVGFAADAPAFPAPMDSVWQRLAEPNGFRDADFDLMINYPGKPIHPLSAV